MHDDSTTSTAIEPDQRYNPIEHEIINHNKATQESLNRNNNGSVQKHLVSHPQENWHRKHYSVGIIEEIKSNVTIHRPVRCMRGTQL